MKKRISLILTMLILLTLVGCGGGSQDVDQGKDETVAEATTPAAVDEEQAEAEEIGTAEAGVDDSGADTRVIVDAVGREVELPAQVNSIVPLGNTPR